MSKTTAIETNLNDAIESFNATANRIADERNELLSDVRDQIAWLKHYLVNYSKHQAVTDERGHTVNSFTGVVIPDWAVKQKLESLELSVAKAEGRA